MNERIHYSKEKSQKAETIFKESGKDKIPGKLLRQATYSLRINWKAMMGKAEIDPLLCWFLICISALFVLFTIPMGNIFPINCLKSHLENLPLIIVIVGFLLCLFSAILKTRLKNTSEGLPEFRKYLIRIERFVSVVTKIFGLLLILLSGSLLYEKILGQNLKRFSINPGYLLRTYLHPNLEFFSIGILFFFILYFTGKYILRCCLKRSEKEATATWIQGVAIGGVCFITLVGSSEFRDYLNNREHPKRDNQVIFIGSGNVHNYLLSKGAEFGRAHFIEGKPTTFWAIEANSGAAMDVVRSAYQHGRNVRGSELLPIIGMMSRDTTIDEMRTEGEDSNFLVIKLHDSPILIARNIVPEKIEDDILPPAVYPFDVGKTLFEHYKEGYNIYIHEEGSGTQETVKENDCNGNDSWVALAFNRIIERSEGQDNEDNSSAISSDFSLDLSTFKTRDTMEWINKDTKKQINNISYGSNFRYYEDNREYYISMESEHDWPNNFLRFSDIGKDYCTDIEKPYHLSEKKLEQCQFDYGECEANPIQNCIEILPVCSCSSRQQGDSEKYLKRPLNLIVRYQDGEIDKSICSALNYLNNICILDIHESRDTCLGVDLNSANNRETVSTENKKGTGTPLLVLGKYCRVNLRRGIKRLLKVDKNGYRLDD